jgi:hypothetical protein
MPEISMTTFVDFVLASGTKRLTCVRKAKKDYRQDYDPARDFYRLLRDTIITMHEESKPKEILDDLLRTPNDPRKALAYSECVNAYKQWCKRKQIEWIGKYNADWIDAKLTVRVNPELGVRINGAPYVIKLYFKGEKPSKRRLETMFHLLQSTLPQELEGAIPGILDVRRGNLFSPKSGDRKYPRFAHW